MPGPLHGIGSVKAITNSDRLQVMESQHYIRTSQCQEESSGMSE